MATNGANNILVLYKVANSECDKDDLFNAFSVPRDGPKGLTLATVKQ
jgi:hypothetical protein